MTDNLSVDDELTALRWGQQEPRGALMARAICDAEAGYSTRSLRAVNHFRHHGVTSVCQRCTGAGIKELSAGVSGG